ncbi:MAG TPA: hypothetical protein VFP44_00270 [Usitatibacter sp.]|nr:hypothetical protein [Usitatibacter sp.]
MKRTAVIGAVVGLAIFAAGCAAPGDRIGGTCPPDCDVTITVTGNCAIAADRDPLEVKHPAAIRFNLGTAGYHFPPGGGIAFNNNPRDFAPGAKGPKTEVVNDSHQTLGYFKYQITVEKDGTNDRCHVDPGVVNN